MGPLLTAAMDKRHWDTDVMQRIALTTRKNIWYKVV